MQSRSCLFVFGRFLAKENESSIRYIFQEDARRAASSIEVDGGRIGSIERH
ncbi:hypothetical protein [Caballeronia novacaledonica]|uniref:hypothetical protein n=1 Tax=Caballeronia novacaledonica TaxID=1544861 RepID=UPI0015E78773|nr:hypothetical protein [Caballeronia novacaledonica]